MKKKDRISHSCCYFFSKDYFSSFLRIKRKIALFLDFDGTLVPIQKNPAQCILSYKIIKQLELLRDSKNCYLIILSGRSLSDIKQKVGIKRIYYGGNHGLDISGSNVRYTHPKAIFAKPIINHIRQQLQKEIEDINGVWLEDKKFTLSLHFRLVRTEDIPRIKKVLYNVVNKYSEKKLLTVIRGKKVLEVVPDVSWDKGKAVLWVLQRLKDKCLPVYVGDDQTDETAFKSLRKKGITIRVGKSKKTFADYYLKGYWEVYRLLQQIQEFVRTL